MEAVKRVKAKEPEPCLGSRNISRGAMWEAAPSWQGLVCSMHMYRELAVVVQHVVC